MRDSTKRPFALRDRHIFALLLLATVAIRLPFLKTYDFVTYDGTYYINHAKTFLGTMNSPSGFPIGYPIIIALFMQLIHDGVRAAQTVSFLAGLGSLFVFYRIAKCFVTATHAFLAAFVLALTPLFVALSMLPMSESIYIFWMLLGLLCFVKDRDALMGLFLGMAAITRPEALGIFAILFILRIRRPKRILRSALGFAVVFCVNVAIQSVTAGKLILVPKTGLFGTSAAHWMLREAWINFAGKESAIGEFQGNAAVSAILVNYLKRAPREVLLLIRHVSPVIFVLALVGVFKKRSFLLASLVPFIAFPLFTPRSEPRFVLPYVPVMILYALIAVEFLLKKAVYRTSLALLVLSAAAGAFFNRALLTTPLLPGADWAKSAAAELRGVIPRGATIADRDPFFSFYVEGKYVEIPLAPYDDVIAHLAGHDVDYLVLHQGRINGFRPSLNPLLCDRALITGEMRFVQFAFFSDFVMIYRRAMRSEPAERRSIMQPVAGRITGLSWSPDGQTIAYCVTAVSGASGLCAVPADSGQSRCIVADSGAVGPISWAPDSKRIVFTARRSGGTNIYITDLAGNIKRITSHAGSDSAPSWSRDGREIVFGSNMSGHNEIWLKNLETGSLRRLTTDGDNEYPAFSPDRKRIAWIRSERGLRVLDRETGRIEEIGAPKIVFFSPAWSPNGKFIAVTAGDWGKVDVYLVTADGGSAATLTKSANAQMGIPTWSPDGRSIAVAVNERQSMRIDVVTEIGPYESRLMNPAPIRIFPPVTRRDDFR